MLFSMLQEYKMQRSQYNMSLSIKNVHVKSVYDSKSSFFWVSPFALAIWWDERDCVEVQVRNFAREPRIIITVSNGDLHSCCLSGKTAQSQIRGGRKTMCKNWWLTLPWRRQSNHNLNYSSHVHHLDQHDRHWSRHRSILGRISCHNWLWRNRRLEER